MIRGRTFESTKGVLFISMLEHDRKPTARAGREAAFEALVRDHQEMVFHLAYRLLGDRAEAEDLSQEVFLKIYRAIDSFRGEASIKTWVYRIVVNSARNRYKWWKRRFRSRTRSLDDDGGGERRSPGSILAGDDPDPERLARSREIRRRVEEGIARLTPDHREVIVLRDLEDLSYEEIARALGIAEGTVKSRIARARLELRGMLADLV